MTDMQHPHDRLEYLRQELRAERISMGELLELQSLAEHIDPDDVELLEAAGVPEYAPDEEEDTRQVLLVIGNPADGFRFVGPVTPNDPELDGFVDDQCHNVDWWYVPVESLKEAITDAEETRK